MKIFFTKRGFTIVEVLVAFVIFAIMASMVSVIIAGTNNVKKDNNALDTEIEKQRQNYYQYDQEKNYSSMGKNDGDMSFDFDGIAPFDIAYAIGDPNDPKDENQLALEYFVGNVDYKSTNNSSKDAKDEAGNSTGSVTSRLDTRIYGSTGIKSIEIKVEDCGAVSGGHKYKFYPLIIQTENLVGKQYEYLAQYRIIMPSIIVDYGYCNKLGNNEMSRFSSESSLSSFKYDVYSPYNRTIRISSRQTADTSIVNKPETNAFYVVLQSEIPNYADVNSYLGYSDNKLTVTKSNDYFVFTCYEEYKKENDAFLAIPSASYPNVFGAFPVAEEESESSETP